MLSPFFSFLNTHFFYLPYVGINYSAISHTNLIGYIILFTLYYFYFNSRSSQTFTNSRVISTAKQLYVFIYNVISGSIGNNGMIFFPFLFFLWFTIFFFNLIGLTPSGFTLGSHFPVTLTLSLIVWFSALIILVDSEGLEYFEHFFSSSVNFYLATFISFVEVLSFVFRAVSLSLRLFANLVAGHVLLHLLGNVIISIFMNPTPGSSWYQEDLDVILLGLFTGVTVFETIISFVQSYVFLLLTCIYLQDTLNNFSKNKFHFSSDIVSFDLATYVKETYSNKDKNYMKSYFSFPNFGYRLNTKIASEKCILVNNIYEYLGSSNEISSLYNEIRADEQQYLYTWKDFDYNSYSIKEKLETFTEKHTYDTKYHVSYDELPDYINIGYKEEFNMPKYYKHKH